MPFDPLLVLSLSCPAPAPAQKQPGSAPHSPGSASKMLQEDTFDLPKKCFHCSSPIATLYFCGTTPLQKETGRSLAKTPALTSLSLKLYSNHIQQLEFQFSRPRQKTAPPAARAGSTAGRGEPPAAAQHHSPYCRPQPNQPSFQTWPC